MKINVNKTGPIIQVRQCILKNIYHSSSYHQRINPSHKGNCGENVSKTKAICRAEIRPHVLLAYLSAELKKNWMIYDAIFQMSTLFV